MPAAEAASATLLLGEAQAAAGQLGEALETIHAPVAENDPAALYLRAGILSALGQWGEARSLFHTLATRPDAPAAAKIGEAEALQALGRTEEAALLLDAVVHAGGASNAVLLRRAVLLSEARPPAEAEAALKAITPATPEEARWKKYAEARLLLRQDQPAPALGLFQNILEEREHLPESLLVAATFGATDAKVALNGTQDADDVIEGFIWHYPGNRWLDSAFRRLDAIYAQEESPSEVELLKWARRPQLRRAALASFYLAKLQLRSRRLEKAAISLDYFLHTYPGTRSRRRLRSCRRNSSACAATSRAPYGRWKPPFAIRRIPLCAPPSSCAPASRISSRASFSSRPLFSKTPPATPPPCGPSPLSTLLWPGSTCTILNGSPRDLRAFIQLQPESPLRGELSLEEGLEQARSGDPRAGESLRTFVRDYPRSPRQAEARLALAEFSLLTGAAEAPPEYLPAANPVPPPPEISAQSAWLAIYLADTQQPRDDRKTIALARQFLIERPGAAQIPEVRMKLGQIYFRREDYANAETQFATLAEGAAGPYTEAALFLAGQCAMKLINPGAVDRALGFFDRVVKLGGPLHLYARQEQAIVQSRLEHEDQAIALYEIILTAPGVDPELWQAALCGKGDSLVALGRRALPQPARLEESIAVYQQLAGTPEVHAVWRNQALYKKAKALELLGRTDEALTAFYDCLNAPASRRARVLLVLQSRL